MTPFDLTPREHNRWVRARALFGVKLRRPDPDETMLSDAEICHGVRSGELQSTAFFTTTTSPRLDHEHQ